MISERYVPYPAYKKLLWNTPIILHFLAAVPCTFHPVAQCIWVVISFPVIFLWLCFIDYIGKKYGINLWPEDNGAAHS